MIKNEYNIIGVMSGTSLDGVDLCWVKFSKQTTWSYHILATKTVQYTDTTKSLLKSAITHDSDELQHLNLRYTRLLGGLIHDFIKTHSIEDLDAVCSHGHTVFHEPEKGLTLQIGNLSDLAQHIEQTLVCDFRAQDVALGGQGAPLVPIGDALLFSEYDFCLNLGGFANISFDSNHQRLAFDICPVNIVLNLYAEILGYPFDSNGALAQQGDIFHPLLQTLNTLDYYQKPSPKSLGVEWVQSQMIPLIDGYNLPPITVLRTLVEHCAAQVTQVIQHHKLKHGLFTGGGAHNSFLMERISEHLGYDIPIQDRHLVDYKEALIFGFLGVLKLRGENNCLRSVTGAMHDHCSGIIYFYTDD